MALPPPPTLGEIRAAVMIRATLGSSGAVSRTAIPVVNEAINMANARIYQRSPWARYTYTVEVPTNNTSRDYDVPDGANGPGGVLTLEIINSSGNRIPLHMNTALYPESSQSFSNTPGRPESYQYIDDVIRLNKLVDNTSFPTLRFQVQRAPVPMIDDQDRASIEREALVQLSVIYLKSILNMEFDRVLMLREFSEYLTDLRSNTGAPAEMLPLQSQRLMGPAYWETSSADPYVQPYSVSWNPAGLW